MSSDAAQSPPAKTADLDKSINAVLIASTAYYPRLTLWKDDRLDEKPQEITCTARALDGLAALCDLYGEESITSVTYLPSRHELVFSNRKSDDVSFTGFVEGLIKLAHHPGNLTECLSYVYDKWPVTYYASHVKGYAERALAGLKQAVSKGPTDERGSKLQHTIQQLTLAVDYISKLSEIEVPSSTTIAATHTHMETIMKVIADARMVPSLAKLNEKLVKDLLDVTVVHRSITSILHSAGGASQVDFLSRDQSPRMTWLPISSKPRQFVGVLDEDTVDGWLKERPLDDLPTAQKVLSKVKDTLAASGDATILADGSIRVECDVGDGLHCFSVLLLHVSKLPDQGIHIGCHISPVCHPCSALLRVMNGSSRIPRFTVSKADDFLILPWALPEEASDDVKQALAEELRNDLIHTAGIIHKWGAF